MQPLYTFNLFGYALHPHLLFECLAYFLGFQLWLLIRRRAPAQPLTFETSAWIIASCLMGAALGSKILAWLEDWPTYLQIITSNATHPTHPLALLSGKTIVGGILGGWIGVESAKKQFHIKSRTGDIYVFPLILGIALGRVGCFLTGLADKTHGSPTKLPFAFDYGDGIMRHPTQLYEITFLITLAIALFITRKSSQHPGDLFRRFIIGYLGFRLAIEFLKPVYAPYLGLSLIQIACIIGIGAAVRSLRSTTPRKTTTPNKSSSTQTTATGTAPHA